jgi:hypothetical protein
MSSLKISIGMMEKMNNIAYALQNQGLCGAQPVFEISDNISARHFRQTHLRPFARI